MTAVGITGHQDIPEAAVGFVRERLQEILAPLQADLVGVSSLAAGADQLFARTVVASGGRLHVVVPCERYEETFHEQEDRQQYGELLASASEIERLPHAGPSEDAFFDAGRRVVNRCDQLLAVWDGQAARGHGGTGDVVDYARKQGKAVFVLWPAGLAR